MAALNRRTAAQILKAGGLISPYLKGVLSEVQAAPTDESITAEEVKEAAEARFAVDASRELTEQQEGEPLRGTLAPQFGLRFGYPGAGALSYVLSSHASPPGRCRDERIVKRRNAVAVTQVGERLSQKPDDERR